MTPRPRRRTSLRRVLLYAWLAGLLVNAAAFAAYTLPRTLEERNQAARAERLRGEIEGLRARNQALKRRSRTATQNEIDVRRFYRTVIGPREQTMLPVLAEVDRLARELRLEPGPQSYDASPLDDGPVVRFRISMPVSGAYGQVVALLDRLERSEHFLTVDEISLRERPQNGAGAADLSLTFSAYFKAPPGQARPARGGRRAAR